jgi:hypothetical protein
MAREITITLSDDEYQAVAAAAEEAGEPIEALLHEAVARRYGQRPMPEPSSEPMSGRALSEYLYSIGFALNVPTGEPDTPEEEAELDRLAQLFSQGKSLVEMIIEDRGPY